MTTVPLSRDNYIKLRNGRNSSEMEGYFLTSQYKQYENFILESINCYLTTAAVRNYNTTICIDIDVPPLVTDHERNYIGERLCKIYRDAGHTVKQSTETDVVTIGFGIKSYYSLGLIFNLQEI